MMIRKKEVLSMDSNSMSFCGESVYIKSTSN